MPVGEIGDPRLEALFGRDAAPAPGVQPIVRLPRRGLSGWTIAGVALVLALLLFSVLQSGRRDQLEPQIRPRGETVTTFSEPPPLYIPPTRGLQPEIERSPTTTPRPSPPTETRPQPMPEPPPRIVYEPRVPQPSRPLPRATQASSGSALVIDMTAPAAPGSGTAAEAGGVVASSHWGGRARASTLADRSNTVVQGTLIPAVLETAFDSTSAGLARAIVSRDVRGFDGKSVLIPRGSRLIGKYEADAAPGQSRALITWTRLIRPDGVTIDLDSPATDTLGRGGVHARVNSHFWTRLGDAVLGSVANIGSGLATRAATGSFIVSMPGSVRQPAGSSQSRGIAPTLTIRAGTSISVFVARDLEFPSGGKTE